MIGFGRKIIWTDEKEINVGNVVRVLENCKSDVIDVACDCQFLIDYEKGKQPIKREKKYRPDIDVKCVDNVASEVTEFKLGYNWGCPITLVQRGEMDSGAENETEAISLLNECYETGGYNAKTQELARYIEITGIGYTFGDINEEYEEGESYFKISVIDPRYAFMIRTTRYTDHRILAGVTYSDDQNGNRFYTVYTKSEQFEVNNGVLAGRVKNPFGIIPLVEWIRSHDRMGCFERQISEMDNLNLMISDFSNDVEQNTQAVWHSNDVEFEKDESGNSIKPGNGKWVVTETSPDGRTPFINPLTISYDYAGMLNNILSRRALILQKCNVPQRNDNSGGSTGVAMSDATGWSAADTAASKEQMIVEPCKMQEVRVVLAVIKKSPVIASDSPLLKLRAVDIKPNIKRQKTYEMSTKINTLATGISHGINYKAMIQLVNLFDDPQQVIADSEDTINRYLASIFDKNSQGIDTENDAPNGDRLMQDLSDQETNSPMMTGKKTVNARKESQSET